MVEPSLEFKRMEDDAWYPVCLERNDEGVVVRFVVHENLTNAIFSSESFYDLSEVLDFQLRFRPRSLRFRRNQCYDLVREQRICVKYFFTKPPKFYDAEISRVWRHDHFYEEGEETCICNFLITWTDGPHKNKVTAMELGDLRKIRTDGPFNPTLDAFLAQQYSIWLAHESDEESVISEEKRSPWD